jgi:hypothetical protein
LQDTAAKRLDTELIRLLNKGDSSASIDGHAREIVDSLLGPNSTFVTALGLQPDEYQKLQTAAIGVLADEVDRLSRKSVDQRSAEALTTEQLNDMTGQLKQLSSSVANMSDKSQKMDDIPPLTKTAITQDTETVSTPETKSLTAQTSARYSIAKVAELGEVFAKEVQASAVILGFLGLPKNGVQEVDKAGQAIGAVSALVSSFGNPLGMLPAIAGLIGVFGGSGHDPMGDIANGIEEIQKQIADLRKLMEAEHQKTMQELYSIEGGLFGLLAIIRDDQTARGGSCVYLVPSNAELGLNNACLSG